MYPKLQSKESWISKKAELGSTDSGSFLSGRTTFIPVSNDEPHKFKDIHVRHKWELKSEGLIPMRKNLLNTPYLITDTIAKCQYYDKDKYGESSNFYALEVLRLARLSHVPPARASSFRFPKPSRTRYPNTKRRGRGRGRQ